MSEDLFRGRLRRVLERRLRPARYGARLPLAVTAWHVPGEPVDVATALGADYAPFGAGERWGPPWGTTWLRCTAALPAEWVGRHAEATVDLGFTGVGPGFTAEGLVYSPDGVPLKGIHPLNRYVPIDPDGSGGVGMAAGPLRAGTRVDFLVEAAANPTIHQPYPWAPTDLGDVRTAGREPLYRFSGAEIAVVDDEVRRLVADVEVLDGLLDVLPAAWPRRYAVMRALTGMMDYLDRTELTGTWSARTAREMIADVLRSPAAATAHQVTAVGHAHIDSAWLWPIRETVRKVARTVANVTALRAVHPELVFAFSQAQQHAWLKEHQPALFERLRAAVADGAVLPVGGMWVESDANLPGGEAMVRQLVHGKRFFLDEYGIESDEIWLPDSFGYSAALPQLFRLAGATRFLSQKLSWNQTNRFPHSTFWWEGLDGSRVLAHFPPVDTYNSDLSAKDLAGARDRYADEGRTSRSLVPFGWGDGGGGPTREMLEHAARLSDLEGLPQVRIGTPAEFFDAAEAEAAGAPVWAGELYLEVHRGTYTTQAAVKRGNRRCEHLLREAELWCATAAVRGLAPYPYEELDALWKEVLLYQFHDILPGSSIAWVYRETTERYAVLERRIADLARAAMAALAGTGRRRLVFNAAPHDRDGVPALGAAVAEEAAVPRAGRADSGRIVLDNDLVRAEIDERGAVVSVYDRVGGRELVPPGADVGLLRLHADHPVGADAWDVDEHYRAAALDLRDADSVDLATDDDGVPVVTVVRSHDGCRFVQRVRLAAGAGRVDFETTVDWHVPQRLCKAVFPLDIRADTVAAEIQFGHVRRPLHRNTSWEMAKFEVYAHRFVHVGEPSYGVALVNDSTYGYDATRHVRPDGGTTTVVALSLARTQQFPDPHADQGEHVFRYSLVCGADVATAVREGYRINLPPRTVVGGDDVAPLVTTDGPAVVEAVKLADDGSGDLVVRLYEPLGDRARVRLSTPEAVRDARLVDLLERDAGPADLDGDGVRITLRPFEILTVRMRLRGQGVPTGQRP
ncbi:alpha-mannosidase [Actinoallomurus soli]|uniref:alpha-mannosidase n=1 Tax=Actinoallomurus soli TaxID=2952535 RepID=UPI0020925F5A|nr:glycoside hydrolase family 38 C-terminal domain-containing protein [Actinoallomurus soli]MCO5970575.1 glycosyl hydrolase-related protein [Actinoallomurus soli]